MNIQKNVFRLSAMALMCVLFASCSKQRYAQQTDYLPAENVVANTVTTQTEVVYSEVEPMDYTNSFEFQLVESEFAVPVFTSETSIEEIITEEFTEVAPAPVVKLSKKEKKAVAAAPLNQRNKIGLILMGAGVVLAVAGLGTVGGVTALSGLVVFLLGVF